MSPFSMDQYKDNLLSIFYLRQGGLAIYGGCDRWLCNAVHI